MDTGRKEPVIGDIGESERDLFVRVVSEKLRPMIVEEVEMTLADTLCTEDEKQEQAWNTLVIMRRLLARFYDLGQKEATMYMPMIMSVIKKVANS